MKCFQRCVCLLVGSISNLGSWTWGLRSLDYVTHHPPPCTPFILKSPFESVLDEPQLTYPSYGLLTPTNIGYWPMAIGYWPLVKLLLVMAIDYWPLAKLLLTMATDYWPLAIGYWWLTVAIGYWPWLLAIDHYLLAIGYYGHWLMTLAIGYWSN